MHDSYYCVSTLSVIGSLLQSSIVITSIALGSIAAVPGIAPGGRRRRRGNAASGLIGIPTAIIG
jgi:hypothetical protein